MEKKTIDKNEDLKDCLEDLLLADLERQGLPEIPVIPDAPEVFVRPEPESVNPSDVFDATLSSSAKSKNIVDKSEINTYNKVRRQRRRPQKTVATPVSLNITNNNTNITNDTVETTSHKVNDSYIRALFAHKAKDGEKVEDWALLGAIYKDAIHELENGKLYYQGKTKLLGQFKTAQQINTWVGHEFFKRMQKRDVLSQDELYKEAMLGFLYKDAVDQLAAGKFAVLGYRDTAQAIRDWVNKEFLRRININI